MCISRVTDKTQGARDTLWSKHTSGCFSLQLSVILTFTQDFPGCSCKYWPQTNHSAWLQVNTTGYCIDDTLRKSCPNRHLIKHIAIQQQQQQQPLHIKTASKPSWCKTYRISFGTWLLMSCKPSLPAEEAAAAATITTQHAAQCCSSTQQNKALSRVHAVPSLLISLCVIHQWKKHDNSRCFVSPTCAELLNKRQHLTVAASIIRKK